MTIAKFIAVGFFLVWLSSMSLVQDTTIADWQQIEVEELFTFRLPQGFTKRLPASKNPVGEYYNGSTKLVFEWRPTVSVAFSERRQTWMRDYEELISRIQGKRANIRTFWENRNGERVYHAELNVGNWEHGELELYMRVESTNSAGLELAKQIFRSIRFPNPIPERPWIRSETLSADYADDTD